MVHLPSGSRSVDFPPDNDHLRRELQGQCRGANTRAGEWAKGQVWILPLPGMGTKRHFIVQI